MCVDRFHIVSLFLYNPCTPSTLSKEAFVYFVCPAEIPQPPFAWKYYHVGSWYPCICLVSLNLVLVPFCWVVCFNGNDSFSVGS